MGLALLLTGAQVRAETQDLTPPLVDAAEPAPPAYQEASPQEFTSDTGTRALRFSLGVVGGALGGVAVGGGTILAICAANPADGWCVLPGMMLGGVLALTVGIPLGTWGMGYLMDGDGSYLAALGGTLAGALAFFGLWSLMNASGGVSDAELWVGYVGMTLPLIGAALAYELTSSLSRKAAAEARKVAVVPALMPGGGGLALAGAF